MDSNSKKINEEFVAYQVVWCKYGKHAEWPSILLDKSVWAHRWSKLKKLSNQKVLVFWLGDGSVANVYTKDVHNYTSNYARFYKKNYSNILYRLAVTEANTIVAELNGHILSSEDTFETIEEVVKTCSCGVICNEKEMLTVMYHVKNRKNVRRYKEAKKQFEIKSLITLSNGCTTNMYSELECNYCGEVMRSSLLLDHLNFVHFGWRFQCTGCKKIVDSRSACKLHSSCPESNKRKNWAYIRCPKLANENWSDYNKSKWHIYKHLNSSSDDESLDESALLESCTACQKSFSDENDLIEHLISFTPCLNSAEVSVQDITTREVSIEKEELSVNVDDELPYPSHGKRKLSDDNRVEPCKKFKINDKALLRMLDQAIHDVLCPPNVVIPDVVQQVKSKPIAKVLPIGANVPPATSSSVLRPEPSIEEEEIVNVNLPMTTEFKNEAKAVLIMANAARALSSFCSQVDQ